MKGQDTELGSYALVSRDEEEPGKYRPTPDHAESDPRADGEDDLEDIAVNDYLLESEKQSLEERQLLRKIDRRIMPCLIAMIILNYLDRNALANARIQGIEFSLGLTGSQFNKAISVFFIGYIGLQIPSNLLLTRVRPSIYLPGCMIAWGCLSGMTAFVQGFHGLIIVRFLLGMVEAPFFPGALFLLSSWYTKEELAFRTSLLYSGSLLAGAFGGIVGAGIEVLLNGFLGLASWRWLFLIDSTSTVLLAGLAMRILPDYPHTTRFLTPEEKALASERIQRHSGMQDRQPTNLLQGLKLAVTDYKVWLLALIIVTKTFASGVTSFIPTLIQTFDSSPVSALLLVAPPYLFATVTALTVSYSSDKRTERSYHIFVPITFAMLGFLIFGINNPTTKTGNILRYLSLFLMLGGIYGSYNVALAWISSTIPHPREKRSAGYAVINTIGNFAQVVSPFLYLESDGPGYKNAMWINGAFCVLCLGAVGALRWRLQRENGKMNGRTRFEYVL